MNIEEFYKRQISLTEWFENASHKESIKLREEDNEKRERLKVLNEIINLPFDKPTQFKAEDLKNKSSEFLKFFEEHKNEYCALRLIPKDPTLPKLRYRGDTVKNAMVWFEKQNIDVSKYKTDFIPHSERPLWSTIFISNKKGISGELIRDMHSILTQGFHEKHKPILFNYDFKALKLTDKGKEARAHIEKVIKSLLVSNSNKRKDIEKKLNGKFSHNYLTGYFETIETKDFGLWFIDYNRILGNTYKDFYIEIKKESSSKKTLHGRSASLGTARGKVRIVMPDKLGEIEFNQDEILVCDMTTPEYIPLMKKALGIVTDRGGVLSHAAIVSREFKIPCIVGTERATKTLKNGDLIEIDANKGIIKMIQKNITPSKVKTL